MYTSVECIWFVICEDVYKYYICDICYICMWVLVLCAYEWCTDVYMCDMLWMVCLCMHWDMCKHVCVCSCVVFCEHVDICVVIHVCVLVGCLCVICNMCVCFLCVRVCLCVHLRCSFLDVWAPWLPSPFPFTGSVSREALGRCFCVDCPGVFLTGAWVPSASHLIGCCADTPFYKITSISGFEQPVP